MASKIMETRNIHSKAGLQLRKIGLQYMIVEANDENVNMSDVYSLNRTAAWMWERVTQGGCTAEGLADGLCEEFDTDRETAIRDVERQLAEWKEYGLIL